MFITLITFIITAVLFVILSLFVKGIWWYYIPAALLIASIYLKIIQSAWQQNAGTLKTSVVRMEPSAAAGHISVISFVYGIISVFIGEWISFVACALLFILSLTMDFRHPQSD